MLNILRSYLKNENYYLIITNNYLYIKNYNKILNINENEILININNINHKIIGNNFKLTKKIDKELKISGNINEIKKYDNN